MAPDSLVPMQTHSVSDPLVSEPTVDEARVGRKAASLARHAAAGFEVPEGLVLTPDVPDAELRAAAAEIVRRLGAGPLDTRLLDIYGHELEDLAIEIIPGEDVPGGYQFPSCFAGDE